MALQYADYQLIIKLFPAGLMNPLFVWVQPTAALCDPAFRRRRVRIRCVQNRTGQIHLQETGIALIPGVDEDVLDILHN